MPTLFDHIRPRLHAQRADDIDDCTEVYADETDGGELVCLDEHDCLNPGGHVFVACCGFVKCIHCPKVAWS